MQALGFGYMKQGTEGTSQPIGLIGGIGLTEVHVYAQRRAPDGQFSGCPHVHAVSDEGYFVLQGSGSVEFHDLTTGYRTLDLQPGHYVHFPPLIMHRLISNGDLVILGMMGNAGLAERGEARIYFGADVDGDPDRFGELLSLPMRLGLEGALQRRDASVAAYQQLMDLWRGDRPAYFTELNRFFSFHCKAMEGLSESFLEQVKRGPLAWACATRQRIEALPSIPIIPPAVVLSRRGTEAGLGMCGVLRPISSLESLPAS
jgi:mannose-6-phosphate isomerase-like protein (cupin superfamily)